MAYYALSQSVDLNVRAWNLLHGPGHLTVTRDAPAHRLVNYSRDAIHFLYQTVTGLARNLSPQMGHVSEEYVRRIGHPIYPLPRGFSSVIRMFQYFLNFRAVGLYRSMTDRALLRTRNKHVRSLAITVLMTEETLYLALSGMDAVAVGDGLHWGPRRTKCVAINHAARDHQHNTEGNEESASSHSA